MILDNDKKKTSYQIKELVLLLKEKQRKQQELIELDNKINSVLSNINEDKNIISLGLK